MNNTRGGFAVLGGFGVIWALTMIMAFPTLIIANGMFKVPISEVVNVKMSLIVFLVWIGFAITGINVLLGLASGQLQVLLPSLVLAAFLVVWPFGPIAACEFYAWLRGDEIHSFVYNDFMQNYVAAARTLSSWLGWTASQSASGRTGAFGLTLQELTSVAIIVNILFGIILALMGFRRFSPSYARYGDDE